MIPEIECYRKQLARHLHCCKDTKVRLLDSFDKNMLSPLLEVSDHPSKVDLHTAFGTPAEAAALLVEQVSEEEKLRYQKQKKLRKVLSICALAAAVVAILALAIYTFYIKEYHIIEMYGTR